MIRQRPQPFIRLITSNPAKRYCTKRRHPLSIPGWFEGMPTSEYITRFNEHNFLKA